MKTNDIKRTVIFKDAQNNKVVFNATITERNGFKEFTASGEYCGSLGQCFDHVSPRTDAQKKLIALWREFHLNGMSAGTPEQNECLNEWSKRTPEQQKEAAIFGYHKIEIGKEFERLTNDFIAYQVKMRAEGVDMSLGYSEGNKSRTDEEEARIYANEHINIFELLKKVENMFINKDFADYYFKVGLLRHNHKQTVKHPKTGEPFTYGCAWYRDDLPGDFETTLNDLIDTIEAEEEEAAERPVNKNDIDLFQEFDSPETALALAIMLELNINEIDDISENSDNYWTVHGCDYLAGGDDQMHDEWDNSLDNYLEECVYPELPENMKYYFDDEKWKSDARMDGRGHSLNHYDGNELEASINGVYYYAYRQ